jgi:Holliday junction resolvasome RuvABC DNA-binding subunit
MGARSGPNSVADAGTHMGAHSKLNAAVLRTQSKEALVGLGWKPAIATAAVAAASAALGTEVTLDRLIFEALRRCPRPTT